MEADLTAIAPAPPAAPARAAITPFGWLVDGANAVGSALIFCAMLLILADVAARDLLGAPIAGVAELVAISVIAIVFLQLASTLRHGRMSRAEIFIDGFSAKHPRAGAALQALYDLAGIAVCAILVYATWPVLARAWTDSEFIGVQGVFTAPTWPVKAIIVFGAALTAIQYAVFLVERLRNAFGRAR